MSRKNNRKGKIDATNAINDATNAINNATTPATINNDERIASLLTQLTNANASKDRREGKRIRRALRSLGYYGGMRRRVTHDNRVSMYPSITPNA